MSLTATHSMSALASWAARNTLRPMRPKPLMPTRTDMGVGPPGSSRKSGAPEAIPRARAATLRSTLARAAVDAAARLARSGRAGARLLGGAGGRRVDPHAPLAHAVLRGADVVERPAHAGQGDAGDQRAGQQRPGERDLARRGTHDAEHALPDEDAAERDVRAGER